MAHIPQIFLVCAFLLLAFSILAPAQEDGEEDYDDDGLSRTFGFNRHFKERPCRYRRHEGVCKKRSECRRPTRHVCRFGLNPIVCCLDHDPATTTTTTTTSTTTTTRKPTKSNRPRPPPTKPKEDLKDIDLTFPDCGLRRPKLPQTSGNIRDNNGRSGDSSRSRGIGGLFRRRGRRERREIHSPQTFKSVVRRDVIRPIIVGGVDATPYTWPWMTAIFRASSNGGNKKFLCGASLISKRYVVTAAHCFDGEKNIDPSKFTIVVGSHDTKNGVEYPIENILLHPGYKQKMYYNDLCLMKIKEPLKLTQKIFPVCLPSDGLRSKIQVGESDVTVTGWGDTSFGGVSSKLLQEVEMPVVPLKECNASYSKVAKANFPQGITNLFICAGLSEGGKDACQGDSGGPMVTKLKDNSWVQLGVVSFGYGCGQAGYPGVYTRLSEYTKWFYDNTDLGK